MRRKLLLSKKMQNTPRHSKLPCRPICNWTTRNDSSHISAILHPNDYCTENISDEENYYIKNARRKTGLGDNTCYCNEKKIKPKLLNRPKTCPFTNKNDPRNYCEDNLLRKPIPTHRCMCPSIETESGTLSKQLGDSGDNEESNGEVIFLPYSDQRQNYENFKALEKENEEEDVIIKYKNERNIESTISDKTGITTNPIENIERSTASQKTADIQEFRKQHYFETYSTEKFVEPAPSHICTHKFILDDRLLPEPLNSDSFGISRCTICDKPMDKEPRSTTDSRFKLSKASSSLAKVSRLPTEIRTTSTLGSRSKTSNTSSSMSKLNSRPDRIIEERSGSTSGSDHTSMKSSQNDLWNYAGYYKHGLVPKPINIGGKHIKIELQLNCDDLALVEEFSKKLRKPQYCNTHALRQQKMVT